jgi:hypothetical protein
VAFATPLSADPQRALAIYGVGTRQRALQRRVGPTASTWDSSPRTLPALAF